MSELRRRVQATKKKQEARCLQEERKCVEFFRKNPEAQPDGSFMRFAFGLGYEAALRDARKRIDRERGSK